MPVAFPIRRNHFVPGRHVTDHQIGLYMQLADPVDGRRREGVDQRGDRLTDREGSAVAVIEEGPRGCQRGDLPLLAGLIVTATLPSGVLARPGSAI